jgi:Tat protein translocase TatB subunit
MFNLTGSEIMFLLIIGLVVLGPEKLPDAIRRVGRLYAELKRMSSGVQTDLRKVMDEPLKEMMNTTNSMKSLFTETAGQFHDAAKDAIDPNFVEYQSPTAVGLSKSSESLTQYELTKDEDDEEVAAPPIMTEEENQTEVTPASLNPLDDIS